jgi:hypothetical protein
MNPNDHEIAVGLGRVEGKLDAFLSMQADQGKRITNVEDALSTLSTEVTTLKATRAAGTSWVSTGIAILGVAIAAAAFFFSGGPIG